MLWKQNAHYLQYNTYLNTGAAAIQYAVRSGGSRIFEKGGGRGNGKVTLGLLRLNINV